ARKRIEGLVVRTPLFRLNVDDAPAEIYLKLENLQPTGSFKVRGAGNAIALLSPAQRSRGVFTCSAGNMAQALAWHAKRLGIPCTVIVPDTAPATKLAAIRRFEATIVQLSWDEVWEIGISRRYAPLQGWTFVHPFADSSMIDGIGASSVLPEMWNLVRPLLEGSLVVSLKEIASAIRLLVERNRVVAEGAGGSAVAAALAGKAGKGRIVCVVSGGNIDTGVPGK